MIDPQLLAIAAAAQSTEAATELLRFAREGRALDGLFIPDAEVIERLLDAAKLAMELAADELPAEAAPVYAAIVAFLEGWAG